MSLRLGPAPRATQPGELGVISRTAIHSRYLGTLCSEDCYQPNGRMAVAGCSLGAMYAANFALKYPSIFHYALCMSGRYEAQF